MSKPSTRSQTGKTARQYESTVGLSHATGPSHATDRAPASQNAPAEGERSVSVLAEAVCSAHGLELVQVRSVTERGEHLIRVFIDRSGSEKGPGYGVSVGDCQAVSRDLSTAMDVYDVEPGHYRLEVSSPGLNRPLVRLRDFERFTGHDVKLQTRLALPTPTGGERRNFRGKLLGTNEGQIVLLVDGSELRLELSDITKANVIFRFD